MEFTRSFALEDISVRSGGDGRTVEAYATVFNIPADVRDADGEYIEVIDWRHRDELEHQLRDIIDAQDRLMGGSYGQCAECGNEIGIKRLVADPAARLCVSCQASAEPELAFHTI